MVVFPELALSGYSVEDLFFQDALLDAVLTALFKLAQEARKLEPILVIGAPLRCENALFNCAVVVHRGQVHGVIPKSYLPNYREFYEKRHFAPGAGQPAQKHQSLWRGRPLRPSSDLHGAADRHCSAR
jgi:NAD+ synthase (glutamine-hydrolysing)